MELMEIVEEMWEELPATLEALEVTCSTGHLPRALKAFEAMPQERKKGDMEVFRMDRTENKQQYVTNQYKSHKSYSYYVIS